MQAGQTLLRGDFEDVELEILEEAAKALGIAIPWDPAEAAQIAAEQAASHARDITYARERLARAQAMLDELSPDKEERLRIGRAQRLENANRQLERLETEQVAGDEAHARKITQARWEVEKRRGLLDSTAFEQERLRKLRIEEVESARRALDSLMAGTDSVNATGAA